jgi:uncharacterized protein
VPDVACERVRITLSPPQVVPDTGAVVWSPPTDLGKPGVVLAPGAGSDLTNPLLRAVGRGLAEHGHPVAVFNFGYTEVGRRRPDPVDRLERAYRDVLGAMRGRFGGRPMVIGGRSMGGRIASHLAADGDECAGLLFLGYPLHPRPRAGEQVPASKLRTAHWPRLRVPSLFVQGQRDALCDLSLFETERAAHLDSALTDVHLVEGADHGFDVRKRDGRTLQEVYEEVVGVASAWLARLDASARSVV